MNTVQPKVQHKIFLATRPIGPPWDESSKNLVYQVAKNIKKFSFILLTAKDHGPVINSPTVIEKKIYLRAKFTRLPLREKIAFFITLIFSKASLYHFYFSPELFSSNILRIARKFKKGKFLQTFPTAIPPKNEKWIPKYAFGDIVIVQSDYSLEKAKKIGVSNVIRIYPAIDTGFFKPRVDATLMRRQLNISPDENVILYAGNFHQGCNDDLIEATISLCRQEKSIKVILACRINLLSDVAEQARIKTAFRKEQISDQVIFLDRVENMVELLSLSKIHVFPPRINYNKADIPMVLLESLAMEIPIVITDISPLNEIMKDDVGTLVPVGNVNKLVESTQNLLANPSLLQKKGERGRKMVIKEFGLKSYTAQYQAVYQNLLESGA